MPTIMGFLSKALKNTKGSASNNGTAVPKQPMWELPPPNPPKSKNPPRILIVGAGSRGNAFGRAIYGSTNGCVAAVAEPIDFKRRAFGRKHIWGLEEPKEGEEFTGWKEFIEWELQRRERAKEGKDVPEGVDGVFVCTLDELHADILTGLAPLGLHILCEKPLATGLQDCLRIYKSLRPNGSMSPSSALFGVGHVLRYSPHNILLRKLLLEDEAIGEIVSIEHTEPVGWWHFSHSYVRYLKSGGAQSILIQSNPFLFNLGATGAKSLQQRRLY
jgi:predicted dehydrogenase